MARSARFARACFSMAKPLPHQQVEGGASVRVGAWLCGRYWIKRLIGEGGMAAVYSGVHRSGHEVAIKLLHERLSDRGDQEKRFRREALLANAIGHPSVVPVIDDDVSEDGFVFLVMPLLRGETLRARCQGSGGRLPVEEVLVVAHALLDVLGAAHARKIVHRDVKPENIFLEDSGAVRVLDFGIARFFDPTGSSSATRSGRAVGTPAFMGPEQALGRSRDVNGRTDLWAVGATMFTLLSGRLVHEADTASETLVLTATKHARPLSEVAPEVPAPIRAVVDRALSFSKDERWPDAAAMNDALAEATELSLGRHLRSLPPLGGRSRETALIHDMSTERPAAVLPILRDLGSSPSESPLRLAVTHTLDVTRRALGSRVWIGAAALTLLASAAAGANRYRRVHEAPAKPHAALTQSASPTGSRASETMDLATILAPDVPPAAVSDYRAGVQLWRDASGADALRRFEGATRADPGFASAHLFAVLVNEWADPSTREHFQQANIFREDLSARARTILDALAPSMKDPSDLGETIRRLNAARSSDPQDVDLLVALSLRQLHNRQYDDARSTAAAARSLDAKGLPVAMWIEARALLGLGRNEEAWRALGGCTSASPSSEDCLELAAVMDANDGRCPDAESTSRRLIAAAPQSPAGYQLLAGSLFGQSHSSEQSRAALELKWSHVPADSRSWSEAQDRVNLALLSGDFASAMGLLDSWTHDPSTSADAFDRGYPRVLRMRMLIELGDLRAAESEAAAFYRESAAWAESEFFDPRIEALRILHFARALPDEEFARQRDQWFLGGRIKGSYFSPAGLRWIEAYAESVSTIDDARTALARMPEGVLVDLSQQDAEIEDVTGTAYLLAGQTESALPHLERAARSCSISKALSLTRAQLHLGMALERKGAIEASCSAYQVVIERWGQEPRSVSATDARRRAAHLGCPLEGRGK